MNTEINHTFRFKMSGPELLFELLLPVAAMYLFFMPWQSSMETWLFVMIIISISFIKIVRFIFLEKFAILSVDKNGIGLSYKNFDTLGWHISWNDIKRAWYTKSRFDNQLVINYKGSRKVLQAKKWKPVNYVNISSRHPTLIDAVSGFAETELCGARESMWRVFASDMDEENPATVPANVMPSLILILALLAVFLVLTISTLSWTIIDKTVFYLPGAIVAGVVAAIHLYLCYRYKIRELTRIVVYTLLAAVIGASSASALIKSVVIAGNETVTAVYVRGERTGDSMYWVSRDRNYPDIEVFSGENSRSDKKTETRVMLKKGFMGVTVIRDADMKMLYKLR